MKDPGQASRAEALLTLLPLGMMPFLYLLRIFPFAAPNEDPKAAVLIAGGALIAAAWLAGGARWEVRRTSAWGWGLGLLLAWIAVGESWTPNPARGGYFLALWGAAGCVWLAAAHAAGSREAWIRRLHAFAAATGAIFSAFFWWDYLFGFPRPDYPIWVLFSPIGHVNFTSDALVLWLPLLWWAAGDEENPAWVRGAAWAGGVSLGAILLIGASRAALAGLLLGGMLVLPAAWRHRRRWRLLSAGPLLAASSLLAAGVLYAGLPIPFRGVSRLAETLAGESPGEVATARKGPHPLPPGATSSGTSHVSARGAAPPSWTRLLSEGPLARRLGGRAPLYASSIAMSLEAPWVGHGTGSFVDLYPAYGSRLDGLRDPLVSGETFVTNPHDALLEVATQNGWPAAALLALLIAAAILRPLAGLWRRAEGALAALTGAMGASLAGIVFSHTLHNPASLFTFALVGGTAWGLSARGKRADRLPGALPLPWRIGAAILLLAALVGPVRYLAGEWYLGRGLARASRPSAALASFQAAIAWNPYSFRAGIAAARIHLVQGRPIRALKRLQRLRSFHPRSAALDRLAADLQRALGATEGTLPDAPGTPR